MIKLGQLYISTIDCKLSTFYRSPATLFPRIDKETLFLRLCFTPPLLVLEYLNFFGLDLPDFPASMGSAAANVVVNDFARGSFAFDSW